MKNELIVTMTKAELQQMISEAVRIELSERLSEEICEEELLSTTQVLDLLKISKPTLYSYVDKGYLKKYKVEGRIYFLRSEIFKMIISQSE